MNSNATVMLVDDSLVIRSALKRLLSTDPDIDVVDSVSDGKTAIERAEKHKPNVVILDIEMPIMDGLTALPEILKKSPTSKVVMFSALTEKGADVTIKALSLGAVECIVKPSSQQNVGEGSEFEINLRTVVKTLAKEAKAAALKRPSAGSSPTPAIKPSETFELNRNPAAYKGRPSLLAIGSSTGGPNALFEVCKHFTNFPIPIVITQHMPATFTKILAQHIKEKTGIPAIEGEEGMALQNGHIYVAPGGYHMLLEKSGVSTVIRLNDGPLINFCRPSVDPMVESAVKIYGSRVLCAILTGMGNDGLGGAQSLVTANGRLIAQDKETSVVWGMPRAVALAGLCTEVLPLEDIGPWLRKQIM